MYAIDQFKSEITALVSTAVKKLYEINVEVVVDAPGKTGSDAATPVAFQLSRQVKKNPAEIAEKIAGEIKPKNLIARCEAVNGYLNFVASEKLFTITLTESGKQNYGAVLKPIGKKAIVEYSSPNVGKPLHVGHMRSTIYGDAVAKLLKNQGWNVVSSNFLCEAGAQVAKLIVGLRHYGAKKIKDEKELLNYYVKINTEIEKSPALAEETRKVLEKMEAGEKEIAAELKRVRELSIPPLNQIYKELNVEFDEDVFDSDYVDAGKKLVEEGVQKNIAFREEKTGEIVAQLEEHSLPNLIILRSNGTTLYSTRDLGLAEARWNKYHPDLSVIVTGSDQNLHFKQFAKILQLLKRPIAEKIRHIGYGLVVLPEGKISSRAGRVVLLQDVIDQASKAAEKEILAREPDTGKKELAQRSRAIGIAAIKFAVLKLSAETTVNFDFDKMASFEGDTGAYVQYSYVRCNSILEKATEEKIKTKKSKSYQFNSEERSLLLQLALFPEILKSSAHSLAPHTLCNYLLKLCAVFSTFYAAHSVIKAESSEARAARLEMVKATANVLRSGLEILGISAVERM